MSKASFDDSGATDVSVCCLGRRTFIGGCWLLVLCVSLSLVFDSSCSCWSLRFSKYLVLSTVFSPLLCHQMPQYNNCPICEKDLLEVKIDQEMTDLMNANKSVKDAVAYEKGHHPYVRCTCLYLYTFSPVPVPWLHWPLPSTPHHQPDTCCGRALHGPCNKQCEEDNVNQCMTKSKCPTCAKKYKKRGTSAEAKFVVKWANQGAEWAITWLQTQADDGNEHAATEKEKVTAP